MSHMKEEINQAAHRCENLGSVENLDQVDLPENSAIAPLAESVNQGLQEAMSEVSLMSISKPLPTAISFS